MQSTRLACVIALLAVVPSARAEVLEANCTGMLNLDIYRIDTELPVQQVEGIGEAKLEMDEAAIVLTGTFGEYRFDRQAGTLYIDGRDSGIYCTWSRPQG